MMSSQIGLWHQAQRHKVPGACGVCPTTWDAGYVGKLYCSHRCQLKEARARAKVARDELINFLEG